MSVAWEKHRVAADVSIECKKSSYDVFSSPPPSLPSLFVDHVCRSRMLCYAFPVSEVVERCGITYSMLSTPEAASDVFFDPQDGVLAGLSPGKGLVDCATLEVEVRPNSLLIATPTINIYRHFLRKNAVPGEALTSGKKQGRLECFLE